MLIAGFVLLGVLSSEAVGGQSRIIGRIPASFDGATRVVWIGADAAGDGVTCGITAPGEWLCEGVLQETHGLVVLVGDDRIRAVAVLLSPIDDADAQWGRIVRITAGSASPDDLHDLTMAAFKPEPARVRTQTRRFNRIKDDDLRVSKLGETAFWVAGGPQDPNGSLVLSGPAIGTQRFAIRHLREGPPEEPIYLSAAAPAALNGRVLGARGIPVDGAAVDVWDLLQPDDRPARLDDRTPVLHRASFKTSSDGLFQFERLDGGPVLITAFHPTLGGGHVWITDSGPSVDVELIAPTRAVGRVVRRSLPMPGALIRFVPDADAFAASADPLDHIAADVRTADDGTFALGLPRSHVGTVVVALDDGGRARVPVPDARIKGDIVLGDIAVPDGSHLTVRLLEGTGCTVVVVGPIGHLGLTFVRVTSVNTAYELDLPEAGSWSLNAECGDRTYGIEPPLVVVQPDRATTSVDARVVKSPG